VLCVKFFVVTATLDIVQCYCVVCAVYCGNSNRIYTDWYCVMCVVYGGYSNIRNSATVLCCLWSILWLHQP